MREYKSCFDITFVCKNVGKQGMSNLISCLIRRARELQFACMSTDQRNVPSTSEFDCSIANGTTVFNNMSAVENGMEHPDTQLQTHSPCMHP